MKSCFAAGACRARGRSRLIACESKQDTGTVVGAIAGGVIGNQFGKGGGKRRGHARRRRGRRHRRQRDRPLARRPRSRACPAGRARCLGARPSGPARALAQSRQRPLRRGDPRRALQARRQRLPRLHAQGVHRRPSAGHARHRLPQPGRHLDPGRLSLRRGPGLDRHRRSRFLPPRPDGRGGFHFERALPEVALHSKTLTELAFQASEQPASYAAPTISPLPLSALLPHCHASEICYKTRDLNLESVVDA